MDYWTDVQGKNVVNLVEHIFAEQTALIMDITDNGLLTTDEFINGKPDLELTEWYSISFQLADALIGSGATVIRSFYGCWLGMPDHQRDIVLFTLNYFKGG